MKELRIGGASLIAMILVGIGSPFTAANAITPPATSYEKQLDPTVIKLLEDADKALTVGNLNLALIQLKNAVRLAPHNGEVRARLGALLLQSREAVAAERELRQARNDKAPDEIVVPGILQAMVLRNEMKELLAEFPNPPKETQDRIAPDILKGRAIALQALGRATEARAAMVGALRLRRDMASLLMGARLAQQQRDLVLARNLTDEAIKLEPTSEDALIINISLMGEGGESQKALAAVDDFISRAPQSATAKLLRVGLLIETQQDAKAKQEIDAFLKQSPTSVYGSYYRAVLLARAKDFKGAWQIAQDLQPEFVQFSPTIAIMISRIAAASGNIETAGAILTTYLSKNPNATDARLQLAAIRLSKKEAAAAINTLAPLKTSSDPVVHTLLAQAYLQLHQFNDAIASLEIATASGSSSDLLKRQLALVELQVGKTDQAIPGLRELSERDPSNVELAGPLIAALVRSGQTDQALMVADRLVKSATKSPMPAFYRGQIFVTQGKLAAASTAFGQALSVDPKFIPALLYRANVSAASGNIAEANRDLQQILTQDPHSVVAYIQLAQVALNNDQLVQVNAILDKAIKAVPNDTVPRLALANYQISRGKYQDAEQTVRAALQVDRNNPEALAQQGHIQFLMGETAAAVRTFRALASQNAQSPAAQNLLAQALIRAKDFAAARNAAKTAVELAPDSAQTRAVLIAAEIADGKSENALTAARNFSAEHPGSASDLLLSETLLGLGQTNDAAAVLEKSLSSRPNSLVALRLSQISKASGNPKKAVAVLENWLSKNPDDFAMRKEYGALFLETGDVAGARREFESLLKQNIEDAAVLNNLGWILQKDDPDRAMSLVSRAERIAPRSPEIVDTLGWMKFQRGDYQGALPLLQRAHDLDTSNAWIAYHFALVLDATGKRAQAKLLLASALAKNPAFEGVESAKKLLASW